MLHYGKKKDVEGMVDWVMETLVFKGSTPGTRRWRRATKWTPEKMGPLWLEFNNPRNEAVEIIDPKHFDSGDVIWPVNFGYVYLDDEHFLRCCNMRSVKPSALRGKAKYPGKFNVRHADWMYQPGDGPHAYEYFSSFRNGEWRDAGTMNGFGETPLLNEPDQTSLELSIALTRRYQWGAGFQMDNSAEIVVPVSPKGILSLFNDRDKPADVDRRKPLRHWVSEFMRQTPSGDYSSVRQHLRANTKFKWRGYDITIYPSQFDIELNQRLAS